MRSNGRWGATFTTTGMTTTANSVKGLFENTGSPGSGGSGTIDEYTP